MATDGEQESGQEIKAIAKAFDIVESLEELEQAGVSELADHLGRPKSTVHVYLRSLERAGYVINEDGTYRLALRFLKHGGYVRNRLKLYKAAKTEVDKLASETEEVGNLGIEENGLRVLVYKSGGPEAIHDNAPTGEYTHMHWTALGKAILAHYPERRVERIVDRHGLPRANEYTITDPDELFNELERTRDRGYSVENQDRREGVLTVGVPIVNTETKRPVGAVSVSGPRNRLWEGELDERIVNAVKQAANVIELQYNHY